MSVADVDEQRQRLAYVIGRDVKAMECNCGKCHFLPGKVSEVRFTGDHASPMAAGTNWDPMDPLSWDVVVKPDDSDDPSDIWYTSLSHVLTDDEFNNAFKLLN